ncbi:MAG: B12-binding domain-containing radical SAM protein [Candidatus Rokubacteria bacterium]|nr:B12-binding domain-containing radical SAM protein [Candidatus Rokubacteria bacterium]
MLFINPAQEKFGGFLSRYVPVGIPVAIGCLSAYLTKHGIKCRVVDEELTALTPSVLRELVDGLDRPYLFGLSCLTAHVARGYHLAAMLKAEFPDSVVVAGGLHPTACPDEALRTGNIDYVVRGEGEEVMLQLHRALRGAGDPTALRGVSFVRDGRIVHNPEAPLIPELDDIPMFPYELFDHPKYDMAFITSSRGCPYKCTYCSQRMLTGTTYRYKSAGRIVQELDVLVNRYGQKQIVFYDDNFCFKARRVTEVCKAIMDAGLHSKCTFSVQTRADNFPPELVPILAAAGFTHAGFGMETGVNRLARLIGKGETVEQHLDAVALGKKHGFDVSLFMIFGLPTETATDRATSFRVVQGARVQASKYNNLIPYPGTPIFNDVKDSNRIHIEPGWSNFNSTLSVTRSIFDTTPLPYVPETTSEFELKRDIIKFNMKTYVTPRAVLAILLGKKGPGWYQLPARWYLKPRELYHIGRIGANVLLNMAVAFLPLRITEPVMNWLNPAMKARPRVAGYDASAFSASHWDKDSAKQKTAVLRAAQEERKATGGVSIGLPPVERSAQKIGV